MTAMQDLYIELEPDVASVVNELFGFSERCLKKENNFLPHAAILTEDGRVEFVAAAPESGKDMTNSTEILPVLHEGLRQKAQQESIKAIGVAENVTITPNGKPSTKAIKVLFEHKRGLTIAVYLPFEKKLFKGYVFGEAFPMAANSEVNAWS